MESETNSDSNSPDLQPPFRQYSDTEIVAEKLVEGFAQGVTSGCFEGALNCGCYLMPCSFVLAIGLLVLTVGAVMAARLAH